jgi:hypothetical protein
VVPHLQDMFFYEIVARHVKTEEENEASEESQTKYLFPRGTTASCRLLHMSPHCVAK